MKNLKGIKELRSQIQTLQKKTKDTSFQKQAKEVLASLTSIEEALHQTKAKSGQDVLNFPIRLNDKIAGLYGVASSGQNAPSKQVREAFAELGGQANEQLIKLSKIMDIDIKQLNKMINDKQIPVIGIK
jgi:hypothetical protein